MAKFSTPMDFRFPWKLEYDVKADWGLDDSTMALELAE